MSLWRLDINTKARLAFAVFLLVSIAAGAIWYFFSVSQYATYQIHTRHVDPLWTEPGWNLHKPNEIGIDSFQADRAPDHVYKTMNLAGVFVHENGLFMRATNKGRF